MVAENAEQPVDDADIAAGMSWQGSAHGLLSDQRKQQRELLATDLVTLFSR